MYNYGSQFGGSLPTAVPSGIASLAANGIVYLFVIIAAFFSIASIYVLIHYGKSRLVGLVVSVAYGTIFLAVVGDAIAILSKLK